MSSTFEEQGQNDIDSLIDEAGVAVFNGQKIQAIKAIRSIRMLGLSLKEAKDVIDHVWQIADKSNIENIKTKIILTLADRGLTVSLPSDWETTSGMLWRLYETLLRTGDKRAQDIKWLAGELDEVWGVA
jgi:hypothetical protein